MSGRPGDLLVPDYGRDTLADVLPGAAASLGVTVQRGDLPADPLGLTEALGGARRVLVLLVDGLGADLVAAHADLAPTLAALTSPAGVLSAPCPSTTPVSLTTLGTGLPPGSHGVLGFVTEVPGEGRLVNHTHWTDDPDPGAWQSRPTVFQQAIAAGVPATVVAPHSFARSGLTAAAYRGAHYAAAFSPGDLVALALQSLAAAPRTLVYGYHAELDLTGHVRGVGSDSWRNQLSVVDRMVEQLVAGLPADGALLVTADHGMIDVGPDTRLDVDTHPDLLDGVRLLAGEPRARYVHAEPGAEADVLARWQGVLGDRAWVMGREEAVQSGVFGPVGAGLDARIGDVVALARGDWVMTATRQEPIPSILAAYHGSLTATELAIPLLMARGGALG
ncbi:alkaline phosphatase family protein [Modestobacter sp. I12A-02628]|uniref:Alkaline phosphatase family protein n=1 Tax=Goekera deserti TaxID=2497753 RepID=A0A7K3WAE8_9ACTN|nr:nucleotide pyrophosphatase/phosphodiesterase family protein [Goekera deserti]MPQ97706.1 alkaline phosphatase family protein [Goekera deserti]NDI47627.1 alkaline phosphatase family protein [Goekera deserti]NDI47690.1 alkaline phosphatase family protein [Goekera deserti]NEL53438.1 alkaline phosphatase family protein [Goekera deserti]